MKFQKASSLTRNKTVNFVKKVVLFVSLVLGGAVISINANEIEVIAPEITGLVRDDKQGSYQLILKEAAKRAGISYKETFYPQKRAVRTFLKNKQSCMYGFTDFAVQELGEERILASYPLSAFKMYIFTNKEGKVLTSLEQLKEIKVGGLLGYELYYRPIRSAGIGIDIERKDELNLRKLQAGRIQAMLGFLPDLNAYKDQLNYSPAHPLMVSYDRITCHNNNVGKQFVEIISPKLEEMKVDGTIEYFLSGYLVE